MYPWSFFIILVVLGSHSEKIKLPQISLFESQKEKRKCWFLLGVRYFSLLTKYLTTNFYHLLPCFSIFSQGSYKLVIIIVSLAKLKRLLKQFHRFALATWMYNKGHCNKMFHGPLAPLNPRSPVWIGDDRQLSTGRHFCHFDQKILVTSSVAVVQRKTPQHPLFPLTIPFLLGQGSGEERKPKYTTFPCAICVYPGGQGTRFPLRIFPGPL